MYKYNLNSEIKREIGLEDLAIEINTGLTDAADNGVGMMKIENAWVDNVRVEGFRVAAVMTRNASRITVANTDGINPGGSPGGGGERYTFLNHRGSADILFINCHADLARHAFLSNGTSSVSGIVVLESTQTQQSLESGGHRKWSTGLLYDNLVSSSPTPGVPDKLSLYNRASGNHGWAAAHSVIWDSETNPGSRMIIQKPPTAQNYCFGCEGTITDYSEYDTAARNALLQLGYVEDTGADMQVTAGGPTVSLFREQLRVRQDHGVAPDAPAKLAAVENNPTEVELTWSDVAQNETGYSIERSENGGAFVEIQTLAANSESYTDTGASTGADVKYRVRSTDGLNKSAYSNESDSLTVSPPPTIDAPSNLSAVESGSLEITLNWTDNADNETSFEIERSDDGGSFANIGSAAANATSFVDNGVSADSAVKYRVRAVNATLQSDYSNESNTIVVSDPDNITAPSGLVAAENNPGEITLTFSDNSGNETNFEVERSEDGGAFANIATLNANTENYVDTNATIGAEVVYRVRAVNTTTGRQSDYSNTSTPLTVNDPNGGGNDQAYFVKMAVNDQSSINHSKGIEVEEIRIYDGSGTNVARDNLGASIVDFSSQKSTSRRNYFAVKVLDGGTSSNYRWRTTTRNEPESFIIIDLAGDGVDVSQVQVEWGKRYANDYRVELLDINGNVIEVQNGDAGYRSKDNFYFD